jgi:hypothetical protein
MLNRFAPLPKDHPAVGIRCGICHNKFVAGDVTTLVPKENGVTAMRRREGTVWHTVEAAICHADCERDAMIFQEAVRRMPNKPEALHMPTHCEACGTPLIGGATKHAPECPWTQILADADRLFLEVNDPGHADPGRGGSEVMPEGISRRDRNDSSGDAD